MSGKGSAPRPFDILREEYEANHSRIFGARQPREPYVYSDPNVVRTPTKTVPDMRSGEGKWVGKKRDGKVVLISKSYQTWRRLVDRCTAGGRMQRLHKSYEGCTLHPAFVTFQGFMEWYAVQVGYGLDGYDVDKDILVRGNKVYGPSTCLVVPEVVNLFFTVKARRDLPVGVTFDARLKSFRAHVSDAGKTKHLGRFKDVKDAADAYQSAKKGVAIKLAQRLEDEKIPVDGRVIDALRNWGVDPLQHASIPPPLPDDHKDEQNKPRNG